METITHAELKHLNLTRTEAAAAGITITYHQARHCKNCGRAIRAGDYCDQSCAMDYAEEHGGPPCPQN